MRAGVRRIGKGLASVVAVTGMLAAGLAASGSAEAATGQGLVINEVYGGGGNSGATLTNDFIELENRGSTAIEVSGWSVQYHSKSASGSWQVTKLTGSIGAGARYLIAEAKGSGGTTPLPASDASGSIPMSATDGTVALVDGDAALTCADSVACAAASVDLVGFGAATIAEGSPATGASNTESVQRSDAADSDDNANDFAAGAPTPGEANSTGGDDGGSTPPTEGTTRIHDIQGTSFVSPLNGQKVTNVPGVVTGVRASGSSRGFWMQDPHADTNPATSEGVFVYTGTAPSVTSGDSVLVTATVKDYYPLASGDSPASTSNLSITELQSPTVYTVSHGNALPEPIVLTPTTVPDPYAPDLGGGNIESTPITPTRSALDFYESVEGMRVQVDDARVVGPSDKYGEQYITTKPAQNVTYRGGTYLPGENETPSGRLELVPADGSNPNVSVSDVFSGATVGAIDYSLYGGYLIAATQLGQVVSGALQPVVAKKAADSQLSVATYNVENLAPSDSADKYARLAGGVVTNLASPDVVALEEVQDNDGATDSGTVAADQTLAKLTGAIHAAGGPLYDWRQIDPVNDEDGGQPGGNIRVAFLFDPTRVAFVDRGGDGVDRSTTATSVVKVHGKPDLTLSPGRIDPGSSAWEDSRKPLVGEFRFRGENVFVIGNHFDSKLGDQNADGRFQYPEQASAVQRQKQATEVHDFVASVLKADKKAKVVVAGDLNDYQFSPALSTLTGAASGRPILRDLITTLPKNEQYTYVYDGISQVLDHILVTAGVGKPDYQVVHVNSEFANQVSDHDPQEVAISAGSKPWALPGLESRRCLPSAIAMDYSDALDKVTYDGVQVGGLSSLARDPRSGGYVSAVDNHGTDPARIWFLSGVTHPRVTRDPLVLKRADGTPYNGTDSDNEGLAVLPNGDFVVSSETEPSIRIFGRDGIQKASLAVPGRFAVAGTAPDGEATVNATLEGLTITPNGKTIVAAMEGALSGDVSADGDATAHRFLVYAQHGRSWVLSKQVEYRAEPGMRIPEVAASGNDSLVVEEAAWSPSIGNSVNLYAVNGLRGAKDVSGIENLSAAPDSAALHKTLVADVVQCPTLGASAKEAQANPLLDNYEGMAVTFSAGRLAGITLISDDNFSQSQTTRVLNLIARLP